MKGRLKLRPFYIETLIMVVVMIGIFLLLIRALSSSHRQSAQAKRLTEAVTIAQNVAESASRARDLSELQNALELDSFQVRGKAGENQNCEGLWRWEHKTVDQEENVQISYMETDYRVTVARTWLDNVTHDHIEISAADGNQQIYSLDAQSNYEAAESS